MTFQFGRGFDLALFSASGQFHCMVKIVKKFCDDPSEFATVKELKQEWKNIMLHNSLAVIAKAAEKAAPKVAGPPPKAALASAKPAALCVLELAKPPAPATKKTKAASKAVASKTASTVPKRMSKASKAAAKGTPVDSSDGIDAIAKAPAHKAAAKTTAAKPPPAKAKAKRARYCFIVQRITSVQLFEPIIPLTPPRFSLAAVKEIRNFKISNTWAQFLENPTQPRLLSPMAPDRQCTVQSDQHARRVLLRQLQCLLDSRLTRRKRRGRATFMLALSTVKL